MPTPDSFSEIDDIVLSGDITINGLLDYSVWRNPVITFSFPDGNSIWSTDAFSGYDSPDQQYEPWYQFSAVPEQNKTYVRDAFERWSDVADVLFVEVSETAALVGDIRIARSGVLNLESDGETVAWAYPPAEAAYAGDIWINPYFPDFSGVWGPQAGSVAFSTLIHEIGHALGLKHPFDGIPLLPGGLDAISNTVMSYDAQAGNDDSYFNFDPTTPMVLDIAAIQYLYGANNTFNPGDDVYTFDDLGFYHQTIWDAGGIDTLHYSGEQDASISLVAGESSRLGNAITVSQFSSGVVSSTVDNIWIARDVIIENAVGGAGNDIIVGNDQSNILSGGEGHDMFQGGAGHDFIDGGQGIDQAIFDGKSWHYQILHAGDGYTVNETGDTGASSTLVSVERLEFADKHLALDTGASGNTGQAISFIGTIAKSYLEDPAVIGLVQHYLDNGSSLQLLFETALNSGLIRTLAGVGQNSVLENADVARLALLNVLNDDTPDTITILTGIMDDFGDNPFSQQAGFLAAVAALDVNVNIDRAELLLTGVEYLPV